MSQYDSNSEKASGWMSTAGILTANDSSWKYSFPSKVLSMKGLFSIHPSLFKNCFRKATQLENFCYVLRNISTMEDRPKGLEGEIFDLLFYSAEIVNFTPMERDEYYYEMRAKRDLANQIAFARKEGVEEGMEKGVEKGQRSIISKLLVAGMPPEDISRMLDMPIEEVLAIQGE